MHEKHTRLGVAVFALALLALVTVAQAQSEPSVSWTQSAVTGTVVSLDTSANTLTIRTDAGKTESFLVGKDITLSALKVGDRVRVEPTSGAGSDPTRTASRLEVVAVPTQRTVSTERPVLGEPAGAGEGSMPATAGSTTGRSVSTDRPLFGQKPPAETAPTPSTPPTTYVAPSAPTPSAPPPTYVAPSAPTAAQAPSPSPSPVRPTTDTREDELPATASAWPFVGVMGLLALVAGLAVRATRKQLS